MLLVMTPETLARKWTAWLFEHREIRLIGDAIAAAVREALEEAKKLCPRHCTCPPGTEMDHKPYCAYGIAAAIAALRGGT